MSLKGIVIFDIDGTVADSEHRVHYIKPKEGEKKNWYKFFKEAANDLPFPHMKVLNLLLANAGYVIYFITGRPDNLREATETWLNTHGLKFNHLFMRKAGDNRPDYTVKEEIFKSSELEGLKDHILCVFEDRLMVCDMWRDMGLQVCVCGDEWRKDGSTAWLNATVASALLENPAIDIG